MSIKPKKVEPDLPSTAECLKYLETELEQWQAQKTEPVMFLRDDDAVGVTPALHKLSGLIEQHEIPLLLATIPKPATQALADFVNERSLVRGAVHGYLHQNHSPKGEKTCELGRHRPIEIVMDELRFGREKLGNLFKGDLSGLLVPPWNRIHDEVVAEIEQAGFEGLSTHAWLKQEMPVKMVNTHVDIMHWSAGKVGREPNWVWNELAKNLEIARLKGGRAVGLLTHHLSHDQKAWDILSMAFDFLNGKVNWVDADSLLDQPEEPLDQGI